MRYQSFGRVVSFISLPLILAWSACNWERLPAVFAAKLAGELVDRDSPLHLRARQQLCRALQRHHDWAWLEMDMACALGLRLLEKGGDEESLRARLQLIQGGARKMRAYTSSDAKRKRTLLREAGDPSTPSRGNLPKARLPVARSGLRGARHRVQSTTRGGGQMQGTGR